MMAYDRRTFTLPSDFDDDTLFAVMLKVGELDTEFRSHNKGQPSDAWRGFAMACEGIRVRFRTMAESDESYRTIIPKGAETHDDRYEEERSVFAFFTSLDLVTAEDEPLDCSNRASWKGCFAGLALH